MKGEDIKAGSNFILSNSKGRIAPVVAARVVIDIKLIPTAAYQELFLARAIVMELFLYPLSMTVQDQHHY